MEVDGTQRGIVSRIESEQQRECDESWDKESVYNRKIRKREREREMQADVRNKSVKITF